MKTVSQAWTWNQDNRWKLQLTWILGDFVSNFADISWWFVLKKVYITLLHLPTIVSDCKVTHNWIPKWRQPIIHGYDTSWLMRFWRHCECLLNIMNNEHPGFALDQGKLLLLVILKMSHCTSARKKLALLSYCLKEVLCWVPEHLCGSFVLISSWTRNRPLFSSSSLR